MKKLAILAAGGVVLGASAAATAQRTIDFDDVTAPTLFNATTALRDHYASLGVTFLGPGPLDGGAILSGTSFGMPARSGANFLAFNRNASLMDGGIPRDPQTVRFDPPATRVSLWAGGGRLVGSFVLEAYDVSGVLVDSDSVDADLWEQLSVSHSGGIGWVEFKEVGFVRNAFLVDDLEWDSGGTCYPDCDGNGVLDFFDFLCFQNAFLAGDPYADCDGNQVLDFFDFLCFQNEFLAGCH